MELGRDKGSRVFGGGNAGPSSITVRIGGRAGDGVRVGVGAANGARLFACEKASVEAVVVIVMVSRELETGRSKPMVRTERSCLVA